MEYMNKKMWSLVIGLVITLLFGLYGIGSKGWDPIGQMIGIGSPEDFLPVTATAVEEVAKTDIDPSVAMANATALTQNRPTTIDDVWESMVNLGLTSNVDPNVSQTVPTDSFGTAAASSPTIFTNNGTSITAIFTIMGIKASCLITIDPAKQIATRTCKQAKTLL